MEIVEMAEFLLTSTDREVVFKACQILHPFHRNLSCDLDRKRFNNNETMIQHA